VRCEDEGIGVALTIVAPQSQDGLRNRLPYVDTGVLSAPSGICANDCRIADRAWFGTLDTA